MNAYEKGQIARKFGHLRKENPFDLGTVEHRDWLVGFVTGRLALSDKLLGKASSAPYTPAEKDESAHRTRNDDEIAATVIGLPVHFRMGMAAWCQGEPRRLLDNESVDYSHNARYEFFSGYDLAQVADFPRQDRIVSLEGERPFSMGDFLDAVATVVRKRGL